ncbi:MAG: glycerate kinase [Ornithinibacter sp.]
MPTVVVASDSFKGSLTSLEVGDAVRLGLLDVAPSAQVVVVPVADGGEGTVAAALAAGWEAVPVMVHGPTGEPVSATLAARRSGSGVTVVVEMADACGLGRLPGGIPAPLTASSRGLGEAVSAALDLGADEVVVGVGGSASTDGGAGLLAALGARLLDAAGADLPDGGAALADLHQLDLSRLDPRLATTALVLAADVDSPLLGPTGAAAVFAPQKGATPDEVAVLEAALTHWSDAVTVAVATSTNRSKLPHPTDSSAGARSTNRSKLPHPTEANDGTGSTYWSKLSQQAGAGAAGGVGFALLAVLGAERRSGVDVVLDLVGLEAALAEADLVVTGEGALDEQTLAGKAVSGVARRARASGIRTVAVCGRRTLDDDGLAALGLHAAYPLSDLEPDPQRSIGDAADLLRRTGRRIAQDWLTPAPE